MDGVEIRGLESSPGTRGDACSDAQSADIGFPVGQSQSPAAPSFSADAVDSNRYLAMERCKRGCASECGAEFSGFSMDRSFYIGVRLSVSLRGVAQILTACLRAAGWPRIDGNGAVHWPHLRPQHLPQHHLQEGCRLPLEEGDLPHHALTRCSTMRCEYELATLCPECADERMKNC